MDSKTLTRVALNLADGLDYSAPQMGDKKVLLRIRNLKQYFPVKGKKNTFVRACDGISLDIYEGETFGLVGESGCGKSTLGRTLLQLYHQTFGRTLYYGRTLDSMAPQYVLKTIRRLQDGLKKLTELEAKSSELLTELERHKDAGENEEAQKRVFHYMEEYSKAKKLAEDAFLDIAQIIGGLLLHADIDRVAAAYDGYFSVAQQRNDVSRQISRLKMRIGEQDSESKKHSLEHKLAQAEVLLAQKDAAVAEKYRDIEQLRASMNTNPDFERIDSFRDSGVDLARLNYNEMRLLRKDLQLIFQDPYSSLNPRMTVGQIIGEGLIAHDFFSSVGSHMQEYTMKVMEDCGLSSYMIHRYPHQFSGGQRQRIGIARSLAVRPKFVVCDEAVSALDVSIQSQILNLLSDLKAQENLTYMFISHDLSVVKYISDRIAVMYLGNIVELAKSEEIFKSPYHPYTEALIQAIPTTDANQERKEVVVLEGDIPSPINPPKGCKFHTRCPRATDICKQVTPEFVEVTPEHFVACHHRLGGQ